MFSTYSFIVLTGLAGYVVSQTYIDSPPLIAQASPVLAVHGQQPKWIGSDSTYVIQSTFPVSDDRGTIIHTTTTSLEYEVATATADTSNDKKGDVSIVITPKLSSTLGNLAVKHCGAPVRKRNLGSCGLSFATDAISDPGFLVNPPSLPTVTANDIAAIIQAGLAAGKFKVAQVGAVTIALVALQAWFQSSDSEGQRGVPNALKIPESVVGTPAASQTSTSAKCTITALELPPICDDRDDCDGLPSKTCVKGTAKNCPCQPARTGIFDTAWQDLNAQSSILSDIGVVNNPDTPTTASSTSTASSTASAPTYSGTPVCVKTGWTVTSDQLKDPQQKFCATFGTKWQIDSTDPQGCSVNVGGTAGQGNINSPADGNAVGLQYGRDNDNAACKDVDMKSITFTLKDCMTALGSASKGCPASDGKSQGGRVGINCAMYGFSGGSGDTAGSPCHLDQKFPNGFIGPP